MIGSRGTARRVRAVGACAVVACVAQALTSGPAAADNCGTITDCFPSAKGVLVALAAVLVIAGVAALLLSGGGLLALLGAGLFEGFGGGLLAAAGGGVIAESGAATLVVGGVAVTAEQLAAALAGGAAITGTGMVVLNEASSAPGSDAGPASTSQGGADRSLGEDPATGTFRQGEYETATRVQTERGVQLSRSTDPSVDWVDAQGRTYDAVGNFPSRFFDQQWPNLQQRIIDHVAKADLVPVDVSQFSPEQVQLVRDFVQQFGSRVFLVGG